MIEKNNVANEQSIVLQLDRRRPISEQVYDALRSAIVNLELMPGTSISESSVCRSTGASRTPVRAAFQRLTEEGLIDVFPQQGSFVSLISLRDIKDSHFIRCALEAAIILAAAKTWTAENSRIAYQSLELQSKAIAAGDFNRFHSEDEHFHSLFATCAGLQGVWGTVLTTKARLTRFYRLFGNTSRLPIVVEEHTAIVKALDSGDKQHALMRLEEHLNKIFDLLEKLPEAYRPYLTE